MAIERLNALKELNYQKQLMFSYLTCERLYPNYAHFSDNFNYGNKHILRSAIDFIAGALLSPNQSDKKKIKFFLTEIERVTPYPHSSILESSALDSCTCILETLDFMVDKKISHLKAISTYATDTVDMYIVDRDDLDFNTDEQFEQKILNDVLMKRELNIQNGIIAYLTKIDSITKADIINLVELQNNDGKSNIDLS